MLRGTIRACSEVVEIAALPALSRRDVHRYFRRAGEHGVDAALLALACRVAADMNAPAPESSNLSQTVTRLLSTYLRYQSEVVDPPRLVTGADLMREFRLAAGPQIGAMLAQLAEEQAAGTVHTRAQALAAAGAWLDCGISPLPGRAEAGSGTSSSPPP